MNASIFQVISCLLDLLLLLLILWFILGFLKVFSFCRKVTRLLCNCSERFTSWTPVYSAQYVTTLIITVANTSMQVEVQLKRPENECY